MEKKNKCLSKVYKDQVQQKVRQKVQQKIAQYMYCTF